MKKSIITRALPVRFLPEHGRTDRILEPGDDGGRGATDDHVSHNADICSV